MKLYGKNVSHIFHVTIKTVYVLVYWPRLILTNKPIHLWSGNIPVSCSLIATVWVDSSHHFEVNVFKSHFEVTLRNVSTEHLFFCN